MVVTHSKSCFHGLTTRQYGTAVGGAPAGGLGAGQHPSTWAEIRGEQLANNVVGGYMQ